MESIVWEHVAAAFFMGAMFGLLLDDFLAWAVRVMNARARR